MAEVDTDLRSGTRQAVEVPYRGSAIASVTDVQGALDSLQAAINTINSVALAADLLLGTANAQIPNGRVPTNTATVSWDLSVANQAKASIVDGSVSLAKMANLAANSILGNNTGSPATPIALTTSQAKALLAISLSTDVSGTLQAAQEPAHTGDVTNTAGSLALAVAAIQGTTVTGTTGTGRVVFQTSPTIATSLTITANSGGLPAGPSGTILQIGAADSTISRVLIDSFASSPVLTFRRADTSNASKSNVSTDESLGSINVFGYGATGYSSGNRASLNMYAAESWTDSAQGTYFTVNTTTKGGTTTAEHFRVSDAGSVGIGNTNPTLAGLHVDKVVGATAAMFGTGVPGLSIVSNYPGVYFNSYYNGSALFMGTGYAGTLAFDPTSGIISFNGSSASGIAGGTATMSASMLVKPNGNVGLNISPTNQFHMLNITDTTPSSTGSYSIRIDSANSANSLTFGQDNSYGYIQTWNSKPLWINSQGNNVYFGPTGFGYGPAGNSIGGAVTQATNKSTGVTLNKISGQITMNNAALAATTQVSFVLTNSLIGATDVVVVSMSGGATDGAYLYFVDQISAGSCRIFVRNNSGGSLSEAIVFNFAVIKATAS